MSHDFSYLSESDAYFDAACQSLRPQPVIDALNGYYLKHNSCGERVKYKWGSETDEKVEAARSKVLKYLGLKPRDYFVSFTLNTTYGLNLILNQIQAPNIRKVITSDIEHNSPFLSTIAFAKKANVPREVIAREPDGSINVSKYDFSGALVVLNCVSNIDGRQLKNLKEVVKTTHKAGGIIIVDAAQAMAHHVDVLYGIEADAICFSAHKMYAPSLGAIVARKDLLDKIDTTFIGGGMVDDVTKDSYTLSSANPDHIHTKFEAGLQAYGEIIALGASIDWLSKLPKSAHKDLVAFSKQLYDFLKTSPKVHVINAEPTPVISFYVDGIGSHLLGSALADENIMARTGYFCCHYYLDHVKHYPPLVRLSLSYATRPSDVEKVIFTLSKLLNT
jgi:cysteine desulfurase/selenocysteine lyase